MIENELVSLLSQRLAGIGRASGMCWLVFGDEIDALDFRGEPRRVNAYALHIQCPWRISASGVILAGSRDIYRPDDGSDDAGFDWDSSGASRFDAVARRLGETLEIERVFVKNVAARDCGDVELTFDNGYVLEIFVDTAIVVESWRLLLNTAPPRHFVVFE